jgi:hypothetical protein
MMQYDHNIKNTILQHIFWIFIKMFKIIYNYYILVIMNKKTYKRKTYRRKTYRRKTYRRKIYRKKRGGNLIAQKLPQIGQKFTTNVLKNKNIKDGFSEMAKGTLDFTKDVSLSTAKGFVQGNTKNVINKDANYNPNPRLMTMPFYGVGYYAPNAPPPTNPNAIAPPPSIEMPDNYEELINQ